jgi:hypothetical protein
MRKSSISAKQPDSLQSSRRLSLETSVHQPGGKGAPERSAKSNSMHRAEVVWQGHRRLLRADELAHESSEARCSCSPLYEIDFLIRFVMKRIVRKAVAATDASRDHE